MESLTHTFSIKTLLILLKENRRMSINDVAESIGESHGSIVHAVDALQEARLIDSRPKKDAPYDRELVLTPTGRSVSERLKEIEDMLGWIGSDEVT
jgi:DNA-binding MarR family transcriptional regulator